MMIMFSKPVSWTSLHTNTALRTQVVMFINSTVVIVLANLIAAGEYIDDYMWTPKGLAKDLWMVLITLILEPFISMIDVQFVFKWLKRRDLAKNPDKYIQKDANEIMESIEFMISTRISKYLVLMMQFLFNLAIFPASALVATIYIPIFYWMDKWWLLRVCKVPRELSYDLIIKLVGFFDIVLIAFTVRLSLIAGWQLFLRFRNNLHS